jgi:hypothetical protein
VFFQRSAGSIDSFDRDFVEGSVCGHVARQNRPCLRAILLPGIEVGDTILLSRETNIVNILANRLRVEDYLAKHPELLRRPADRPMFVFGLPRTGTTLTINRLHADPARRPLLRWEALDSVPPLRLAFDCGAPWSHRVQQMRPSSCRRQRRPFARAFARSPSLSETRP